MKYYVAYFSRNIGIIPTIIVGTYEEVKNIPINNESYFCSYYEFDTEFEARLFVKLNYKGTDKTEMFYI